MKEGLIYFQRKKFSYRFLLLVLFYYFYLCLATKPIYRKVQQTKGPEPF